MTSLRLTSTILILCFALQLCFWSQTRNMMPRWLNVPPAPSIDGSAGGALGDKQLAYRAYGVTMQSVGDYGGEVVALKDLDYDMLAKWFDVLDHLDPISNFMPMMVAYYFSATTDADQLDNVIDYLHRIGTRDGGKGKKWRWLVNAIFFAKHKQKDLDKALALSYDLAALEKEGTKLPAWAINMPSFIMLEQGDKESAYQMVIRILQDSAEDLHPNEVNFMVDYLCNRVLDKNESAVHPLCQSE